jgi:hypothetical protein
MMSPLVVWPGYCAADLLLKTYSFDALCFNSECSHISTTAPGFADLLGSGTDPG